MGESAFTWELFIERHSTPPPPWNPSLVQKADKYVPVFVASSEDETPTGRPFTCEGLWYAADPVVSAGDLRLTLDGSREKSNTGHVLLSVNVSAYR